MRRHFIWFGLAIGWGIAALVGFLRHHSPQAAPAALFALLFAVIGFLISKRDASIRNKRTSRPI